MVGKKGAAKYVVSTYISSSSGNYFLAGRKKWGWILLAVTIAALYMGHNLADIVPTVAGVLRRRTAALWGITSPTRLIQLGLLEILIWEGTALLGCIVGGWRLYKNTD